jgi:alkaline phosphatase
MKALYRYVVALAVVLGGQLAAQGLEAQQQRTPTRVILFIGDGVGAAYWTAALLATDALAVQQLPVVGLVDTRSTSYITDSAAGATAYATGVRTYNGAIGVGPDSLPRKTVLEIARERGLATGLVATSSITHATPAAFAAHVASRAEEFEIASQMARQDITVLLGGGRRFFDRAQRPDGQDLLGQMLRSYTYVSSPDSLLPAAQRGPARLLGLFAEQGMPKAMGRSPSLAQMTRAALAVLTRDPDGFFLMVEGSQPDWRGHENAPLREVVDEMLDFDRAIAEAIEYQRGRPETLIVVVADHETGGLAIQADSAGMITARYTTTSHTGEMVPLFAGGPGAQRFAGILTSSRVGELLIDAVRR